MGFTFPKASRYPGAAERTAEEAQMRSDWVDKFLPPMKCDKGCTECCTFAPSSGGDFESVKKYAERNGITPLRQGLRCPFYQNGACAVYPARPLICRLYGHVPGMECPRGYNVNVTLTVERKIRIRGGADEIVTGMRMLHELVYSFDEMNAMVEDALGPPAPGVVITKADAYAFARGLGLIGKLNTARIFVDITTGDAQLLGGQEVPVGLAERAGR